SITATVEPATAKRGETVTWKVVVELIDGWHTYPTVQPDPEAGSYRTTFKFPGSGDLVFVGKVKEPIQKSKEEPSLKIKDLREAFGKVVFERPLVVSPKATPGPKEVKATIRLQVCDKDRCLNPKNVSLQATLTVSDAPAVPVDPKYKGDVEAA